MKLKKFIYTIIEDGTRGQQISFLRTFSLFVGECNLVKTWKKRLDAAKTRVRFQDFLSETYNPDGRKNCTIRFMEEAIRLECVTINERQLDKVNNTLTSSGADRYLYHITSKISCDRYESVYVNKKSTLYRKAIDFGSVSIDDFVNAINTYYNTLLAGMSFHWLTSELVKDDKSRNLCLYPDLHLAFANLVKSQVKWYATDVDQQEKVIEKFILITLKFLSAKNFDAFFAMTHALELHATDNYKSTSSCKKFRKITSAKGNYRAYTKLVKRMSDYIPYTGILMQKTVGCTQNAIVDKLNSSVNVDLYKRLAHYVNNFASTVEFTHGSKMLPKSRKIVMMFLKYRDSE